MSETLYRMDKVQKNLLENFLTARNQGLLFSKGNVNPETGKPTIVDPNVLGSITFKLYKNLFNY